MRRYDAGGTWTAYAELAGVLDHPWNEIVVDGRGNAYVNSIGFDMMAGEPPGPGTVAVVRPDGSVAQAAGDLEFPNGMAITPDGSTLIVAESDAQRLTAFDVEADGTLTNRRVWASIDGYPDGICLDAEGAVWCAAMTTCLRVREGGAVLDRVELDRSPSPACWAVTTAGRCSSMAAEWKGPAGMTGEVRTGRVVTTRAPARHAGRP